MGGALRPVAGLLGPPETATAGQQQLAVVLLPQSVAGLATAVSSRDWTGSS